MRCGAPHPLLTGLVLSAEAQLRGTRTLLILQG